MIPDYDINSDGVITVDNETVGTLKFKWHPRDKECLWYVVFPNGGIFGFSSSPRAAVNGMFRNTPAYK